MQTDANEGFGDVSGEAPSAVRCLVVWLLVSTAVLGTWSGVGGAAVSLASAAVWHGTFDDLLVAVASAALIACAGWLWVITTATVAGVVGGRTRAQRREASPGGWSWSRAGRPSSPGWAAPPWPTPGRLRLGRPLAGRPADARPSGGRPHRPGTGARPRGRGPTRATVVRRSRPPTRRRSPSAPATRSGRSPPHGSVPVRTSPRSTPPGASSTRPTATRSAATPT